MPDINGRLDCEDKLVCWHWLDKLCVLADISHLALKQTAFLRL